MTPLSPSLLGEYGRRPGGGRAPARKTTPRRPAKLGHVFEGLTLRRAQRLRRSLTPPERVFWRALRLRQADGLRFRRQHPVGPWIVDFFCAEHRLAVEVDGWGHNQGELGRDERRDEDLARRRVRVLRFAAVDTMRDVEAVVQTVLATIRG